MPGPQLQLRQRWIAFVAGGFVLSLLSLWFLAPGSSLGSFLERASFDSLTRVGSTVRSANTNLPIVIVYLDLESHLRLKQDPFAPLDRALQARLLRRLTEAKAQAVVFDIIFTGAGQNPQADQELTDAIRAHGKVVLGAELNRSGRQTEGPASFASQTLVMPYEPFRRVAAGWGVADIQVDADFVPRRSFVGFTRPPQPSLAFTTARLVRPDDKAANPCTNQNWIRYSEPPLTTPHVSFADALDRKAISDAFFENKIVFVGARPMAGLFRDRRDEFPSPFGSWPGRDLFIPGVEVHATEFANLVAGDGLRRLSGGAESLLLVANAWFWVWLFLRLPIGGGAVAGLTGVIVITSASMWAWLQPGVWVPWLSFAAVQIPGAFAGSTIVQGADWYRQRRRMEAAKREADETIREQAALIDKAQDAILVVSLEGPTLYANPSATRLYGWSLAELQSTGAATSFSPEDNASASEIRQQVLARGEWIGELIQTTKSSAKLIIQSHWTLIRDGDGKPKSMLVINTDITEKRRLELEVLRAHRVETIGTLANGIAHDLNNALSPVLLGIEVLRRGSGTDDARVLAMMEMSTLRGADMLRQILLFSRGDEGARESIVPAKLLRELESILRPTLPKQIVLNVLVPRDSWPVSANPTQLHHVLLNLCVNARDAMPAGGQLTIATDNVSLNEAEAALLPGAAAGDFILLIVSDTGEGIPSETLSRIFEPFFTTKPSGKGTGLGLSTVRRIVQNHGGFIGVRSEPGNGTTFDVYLPRATASPPASKPVPDQGVLRGNGELILIIHGDRAMRELMVMCLQEAGYRTLTASDLAEGILLVQAHRDAIQLIVFDVGSATEDVSKILACIRAEHRIACILLGTEEQHVSAGESGDDPAPIVWVPKPVRPAELLLCIQKLVLDPFPQTTPPSVQFAPSSN